ncbi:AI-2E family transporter [Oceanobacillus jeddahense]|uniref:AI-2E family transporter n=1 Tax=Oceanobacillus jeddahense TaxID=1462527 RepID=A0ABY5JUS4_9BACI|nr:AI-2E family transporter [Oceanobacillus jeddahense]UUI03914.1 AI-2E family transporter [Oceanobacillus jeddahense]
MKSVNDKIDLFKRFFLNNRFVVFLVILLLIGLNILIFTHISFVFTPFVVLLKTVLLPIILSAILYYLLNPIVNYLEKKNVKRIYSIFGLYLIIIAILTILISSVFPFLRDQITSFITSLPPFISDIETMVNDFVGGNFVNQFQLVEYIDLQGFATQISDRSLDIVNSAFSNIGSVIGAVTEIVLAIVTLPFILFYLLKDGEKLPGYFLKFLPVSMRQPTFVILKEMNHQISSFIRGQIIVAFCIGVLMYIGFTIIRLEYAPVLALIAAFTNVVPYLGPAIAITPALIIAIVTSPFMVIKLIIVWTIVQLIEGKFISPQIMGRNLRVHPITIIFIILTAGNLFGVVGILLAVPGYALLKVFVTHAFEFFKIRSHLYEEDLKSEKDKENNIQKE